MIPVIDFLQTRDKTKTVDELPERDRLYMIVKLYLLSTLVWNYADTVLDIASQMEIRETREASRAVREIRRRYDQMCSSTLSGKDMRVAENLSELFEDINAATFTRLCAGIRTEVGCRFSLSEENMLLVCAVQMAMTVVDTIRLFTSECDAWMGSHGISGCTIMPKYISSLALLLPLYAGDCYDPKSESRRTTARILLKEIKKIELYNEKGKI